MDADHHTDVLQRFLSAFQALSNSDQARARQLIVNSDPAVSAQRSRNDLVPISPNTGDTHSCRICQNLHLTHILDDQEAQLALDDLMRFGTETLRLTKKILADSNSRRCLIVQWAIEYLHQSLDTFKKELETKKVSSAMRWFDGTMKLSADDLDYIDPRSGVSVQLYWSGHDSTASIRFSYAANPHLLGSLWDASHFEQELDDTPAGYDRFVRRFERSQLIRARIFTATANPMIPEVLVRSEVDRSDLGPGFNLASRWLGDCQLKHDTCPKPYGLLPTRVIDLGTRRPIMSVSLHWSEEGEQGQYVGTLILPEMTVGQFPGV
ncbi:hypothetical protein BU25DRAFT_178119 [Macroventuria anomochaeta]|uniref:Uncharacterized protein n=1 Tax=Macroventuria anomochaeta TaxID=301207 RepID=A0ACB6RNC4_9PLEO|nr:uncharacterized protein BU25DRAFT_178119 [Macroventuria anomochaeta]KAF2623386.1 hypothetical protein BU25DRAFT_178119 [Macroventuria anomochaeta]